MALARLVCVQQSLLERIWRRSLVLIAGLFAAKLAVVALRIADGGGSSLASAWSIPALLYQDFALTLGVFAADCAGMRVFQGVRRGATAVERVAWAVVFALVAYSALNVVVARVFSTPLTLPMLGATGAALSDSILAMVTPTNVLAVVAVVGAVVLAV